MDAKFVHPGDALDYTPASTVDAGSVVIQGGLVGITKLDIAAGQLGAIAINGVFDVKKDSSTVSAGAAVYWNATSGFATVTSTSNTKLGLAAEAVTSGGTAVRVVLGK